MSLYAKHSLNAEKLHIQAKTFYHKTKGHERNACSGPGKKRSFSGKKDSWIALAMHIASVCAAQRLIVTRSTPAGHL